MNIIKTYILHIKKDSYGITKKNKKQNSLIFSYSFIISLEYTHKQTEGIYVNGYREKYKRNVSWVKKYLSRVQIK